MPLYRWDVHRETGYRWWTRRVSLTREIFHLFRIDHMLGFYRIFGFPWRPQANGEFTALRRRGQRRPAASCPISSPAPMTRTSTARKIAAMARKSCASSSRKPGRSASSARTSARSRPTSARTSRRSASPVLRSRLWETKYDGWLIDGADYQRLSLATYATHDHEPLRAWWDRRTRAVAAAAPDRDACWDQLAKLAGFAHLELREPLPWSEALHETLLRGLFASNSWIAVCMITDFFGSAQRFNVPGAVAESNWSERLPYPISIWRSSPPSWPRPRPSVPCSARPDGFKAILL